MLRDVLLALSESSLARRIATDAPFARSVVRRFVAGESEEDAIAAARALNGDGMHVSLDYLGEAVANQQEALAAEAAIERVVRAVARDDLDANVSVKLTQLGQDIDDAFLRRTVASLLDAAEECDLFVRFDMESSEYTQRTLDFFEELWQAGRRNIGVVLQSYLYRTEQDVARVNELGARVRLCKGAYKEPERVAYPDKADVDANFVRCMKTLLTEGNYPGIATHDEAMIDATKRFARERRIDLDSFEFQMLYGVRRDIQKRLVEEGYHLRIYVPYGEAWYPYFMRRMAERPANLFFVVDSVVRESPLGFLRPDGRGSSRR
ncbi:MAG TPA: proline dehydrogenase family protein [Longimicrobiales bacterium]|nr:proline dehydrogenase family protein [Longimicrobiales bacterium]